MLRRLLALLALGLVAAAVWFLIELYQPLHSGGHGSVRVTIPPGSGTNRIGTILERDGVIASAFFFKLRAALDGDRGKLRAGTYRMPLGTTYAAALRILTTAPPAAPTSEVTVVPGRSRDEIDALLRAQHVRGSYLAATRHSPLLAPAAFGAPRSVPSLEGFLFPDTYQLRTPIAVALLVADKLREFKQQFAGVDLRSARSKHLTAYDVLIIASMVEDEAATARDRPLVASVIYNRLRDRMPLGIDATIRYALNDWKAPLTESQLRSGSPYNTRTHLGLPPTPIDSPGLASIEAAAHPASTRELYFVVKPCGNGEMTFTSSYQQFLRDSAAYQAARVRRGGRSPEKC